MKENKLIAEFMGLPKVPCNIGTEDGYFTEGYKHPNVAVPTIPSGMQYKYSWNWLMDVVEKIEDMGCEIVITNGKCTISGSNDYYEATIGKSRRGSTYQAVVEFINEYNRTNDER